jgi:Ca2+-binding RTX toxin-like protein
LLGGEHHGSDFLDGGDGNDGLFGQGGDDWLYGGAGDDFLHGDDVASRLGESWHGNDYLDGGDGNDTLIGGGGHDVLVGGQGNDWLEGGSGDDHYIVAPGTGFDTIIEESGTDTLSVGAAASTVSVRLVGGSTLVLSHAGEDFVAIQNYFGSPVETIRFADGTAWSMQDVHQLLGIEEDIDSHPPFTTYIEVDASSQPQAGGTQQADLMVGSGAGDLVMWGGAGDDTLVAGASGLNILVGGAGNDRYVVRSGSGAVSIAPAPYALFGEDWRTADEGVDTLVLAAQRDHLNITVQMLPDPTTGTPTESLVIAWLDGSASVVVRDFARTTLGGLPVDRVEFSDGSSMSMEELIASIAAPSTPGTDRLIGTSFGEVIRGGGGYDWIEGRGGNDRLYGEDAAGEPLDHTDDHLFGGAGDDLLDGGTGNDVLDGGSGNDIFVFGQGSGHDMVVNWHQATDQASTTDIIQLKDGLTPNDVQVKWDDDASHIVLMLVSTGETITFSIRQEGRYAGDIDAVHFADGTVWTDVDLAAMANTPTPGNDVIVGTPHSDTLMGLDGDDTLWGRSGDDILIGGTGNDSIDGGRGADTLVFNRGDGQDAYWGYEFFDAATDAPDILQFGPGISPDEVRVWRADAVGHNHEVIFTVGTVTGSSEQLRFYGLMQHPESLAEVRFHDGTVWHGSEIFERIGGVLGLDTNDASVEHLRGLAAGGIILGLGGNDHLHGSDFDDLLDGGEGQDIMQGGHGDDVYIVDHVGDLVGEGLGSGWDRVESSVRYTLTEGVEELRLTGSADIQGTGNALDNVLIGNGANNVLRGLDGNDHLEGAAGDDVLIGGAGNDVYVYRSGHGADVIDNRGGGQDEVHFADIAQARLSFHRVGDDLVMLVDGDLGQQIRVASHFLGGETAISQVRIGASTVLSAAELELLLTSLGEDPEQPGDPADPGEPPPPVQGADDVLVGSDGNDVLLGGAGNDRLDGSLGDDTLIGGSGDDTYVYTSGWDVVEESGGGNDTLVFGNGITFSQVASNLMKWENDLVLQVDGPESGEVILKNYFLGGDHLVETIAFETGGQITAEQVFGAFGLPLPALTSEYQHTVNGTSGDDDELTGSAQRDLLRGFNGNDTLLGGASDDRLEGGNGHDVLIGGTGDDLLQGGRGDDLYVFTAGDGQDVIDNTGGGADRLHFEGIDFEQVASGLMMWGNDLVLNISGGSDKVTIKDWFRGGDHVIDSITFASGGVISAEDISMVFDAGGPSAVESPNYQGVPDERGFSAVLSAREDEHFILGSAEADLIDAGMGNDILRGGGGNDYLMGGDGSDTYMFGIGDGQDVINNLSNNPDDDTDVLSIEGVAREDLWLSRQGNDLVIDVVGSEDRVTVQDWYTMPSQQLDSIQAGAWSLQASQVDNLVNAMAAFGAPAGGEIVLTQTQRDHLNGVIAASWS